MTFFDLTTLNIELIRNPTRADADCDFVDFFDRMYDFFDALEVLGNERVIGTVKIPTSEVKNFYRALNRERVNGCTGFDELSNV